MHPAVVQAIQLLVQQGKEPSVALIKSKLSQPVTMPEVISGLTHYKQNPDVFNQDSFKTQPEKARTAPGKSQLDRIEAKLDKLIALLESN